MFKNLTDFAYTRNRKEALGFYLAYFFLSLLIGAAVGALSATDTTTFEESVEAGLTSGIYVATIYCLIVTCLVLIRKRLYKDFKNILLVALSPLVAIFLGSMFGLIIPAILTTKETIPPAGASTDTPSDPTPTEPTSSSDPTDTTDTPGSSDSNSSD